MDGELFPARVVELMYRFQEHRRWMLKYDPVMEYWMVCREISSGLQVVAHSRDIMGAVELALGDEDNDR